MINKDELVKLGFSPHEATVYLNLIDTGLTGAGELIKRTGLHRNIIYDTLNKLILRKYVFKVIKSKKAQFQVADPNQIITDLQLKLDLASQIVPDLASRASVKQEILVYEGVDGFLDATWTQIERMQKGDTQYVLGVITDKWYELMESEYARYTKLLKKKEVTIKMLAYEEFKDWERYSVRFLSENYRTPANTLIWKDMVTIQILSDPINVIDIKNQILADSYMNYFKLLWDKGVEKV